MELTRRAPASLWYRAHLRQAAVLGVVLTAALLLILAIPLLIVLGFRITDTTLTIWIYAIALIIDAFAFAAAAALVILSAVRASRGEIFTIPLVTRLGERVFLRRRA